MKTDEQTEDFLHDLRIERGLAANTISSYRLDLKEFRQFLDQQHITDLVKVDQLTILNFLKQQQTSGKARNSVTRMVSTLRHFFQYLVENDQLTVDPMAEIISR